MRERASERARAFFLTKKIVSVVAEIATWQRKRHMAASAPHGSVSELEWHPNATECHLIDGTEAGGLAKVTQTTSVF
eukprot:SAG11_NODE_917_length_6553_cov_24.570654_5_plen_77_part_00